MAQGEAEPPLDCRSLFPQIGAHVPHLDCKCGFRNIIYSPEPAPDTRLDSARCMACGAVLACPRCRHELQEGYITDVDAILICPACGLWFIIW